MTESANFIVFILPNSVKQNPLIPIFPVIFFPFPHRLYKFYLQGGFILAIKEKFSIKLPGGAGPILRGLVVSYLLVAILSLIAGLLFYFTPLSEMWMHPIGAGITTIALFFGGRVAAKAAGNKGLIHGLTIGIIFILITIIMSLFSSHDISLSSLALKSAYALLASAIGGISGVK